MDLLNVLNAEVDNDNNTSTTPDENHPPTNIDAQLNENPTDHGLWGAMPPLVSNGTEAQSEEFPSGGDNRENEPPTTYPESGAASEAGQEIKVEEPEAEVDTRFFPALQLREVLAEILAHLDNATAAAATRVSTQWSEVALDTLYKRSPELYDLVSILAPISETSFSRELLPSDWDRFLHYAHRVRTLSHDTTGSLSGRHLSETVFQELSLSRPFLQMLPNLRTFTWTASRPRFLRASLLFLHETLTSLTLRITRSDGAKSFESYLQVLTQRTPNLTYFELDCPRPVSEYEEHFVALLSNLKHLSSIVLPHFFLTTKVITALSSLPLLKSISLRKGDHIGDSKDLASLRLPTSRDAFPSITRLSLDVSLHEVQSFLLSKQPQSFSHLTYIHISSLSLESPADIHSFFTILPNACPNLSGLMLALLSLSVSNPSYPTDITFETIRPVFDIPRLKDFGLTYNYPLRITHDDCELLAKGFSNLHSLYLCESSYDTHDRTATSLSLASLLPFAAHCPNMETLGLFMDAAPPSLLVDDTDAPATGDNTQDITNLDTCQYPSSPFLPTVTSPFKCLQTLSVGQSFLPSTHIVPTAVFLSQLLPPGCQFQTGCTDKPHCFSPTYHEASPHPESDDAFQTRLNQWAEVKKLVPTLQSIKLKERERAIEAEREKVLLMGEVERLKKELETLKAVCQ